MSTHPNNRASLLAGLRTGGVRSASLNVPHTAAPGATFNVPRFPSHSTYVQEEEDELLAELHSHNVYPNRAMPMTAAVDGPNNHFARQQQIHPQNGVNTIPFSPAFSPQVLAHPQFAQNQALQMQMLQIEMMKMQALQVQQQQAELLAQQLHQQQQQQASRNRRTSFNPPASAGPMSNSFDLRAAAISAQMRRANQTEQLRSQLGTPSDDQVPMTAALGGRFGSRTVSANIAPGLSRFPEESNDFAPPPTPSSTTVISGGTSLGNLSSSANGHNTPSKSDSVSSWRRGGNNNSVLSGNNRPALSPSVKITPPVETQRVSPPPAPSPTSTSGPKFRPQPLRFSMAASEPLPSVIVDGNAEDDTDADTHSSSSVASNSSPTTPRSSASSSESSLSPREEASKKLYEGLGIGRPLSVAASEQVQQPLLTTTVAPHRMGNQATRQPRGPPSGADELGPKNFASRIRRKAIGGLGMLMDARERREVVEAF